MAVNATTNAGAGNNLAPTMMTFYVKTFLERAKEELVHEQGLQQRTHPRNSGKTVNFTRYKNPAKVTAALTEGFNPPETSLDSETVAATLAEYGNSWKLSRFLSLTDIDDNNREKIELAGQNMGESRDIRVRNELFTGATVVRPPGATSDITTTSAMKLDAAGLRLVAARLRKNKTPKVGGRFPWMGKIGVEAIYDITGDNIWTNAKTYSDVQDLYTGEIGELHGVRLLETTQPFIQVGAGAGTPPADLYSNFFHGRDPAGYMDLEGDQMTVNIIPHTKLDSGNTAGRFGFISWAGAEAVKTLNSEWLINYKTGASTV